MSEAQRVLTYYLARGKLSGGGYLKGVNMDQVTQESEEVSENGATSEPQVKAKLKPRPTKVLPTSRIAFEKQLDILRAYPALSGPDHKPIKNKEVADLVDMTENTVSLANPFFIDVGFLQRQDGGLIPGEEVFHLLQAHEWEPESSAHRLAPRLEISWFGQALIPRLSFGPMDESRALAILGEAATASPEYTPQLRLLISYLEAAGLIERENGQLKSVKQRHHVSSVPAVPGHTQQPRHSEKEQPTGEPSSVQQVVIQQSENLIQFHIALSFDLKEIARLSPEKISAFFSGIAEVIKAKGTIEGIEKGEK